MRRKPTDDDVIAFETINREINLLMKRLAAKKMCPCCVAQGMMYRGAFLHQEVAGTDETVALCLDIADTIELPDDGMPEGHTQHGRQRDNGWKQMTSSGMG
jgi:hypothetical protein